MAGQYGARRNDSRCQLHRDRVQTPQSTLRSQQHPGLMQLNEQNIAHGQHKQQMATAREDLRGGDFP